MSNPKARDWYDVTIAEMSKQVPSNHLVHRMLRAGNQNYKQAGMEWRQGLVENVVRPITLPEVVRALLPIGHYCSKCQQQRARYHRDDTPRLWHVSDREATCTVCANLDFRDITNEIHEDLSPQRAITTSRSSKVVEDEIVDRCRNMISEASGRCTGPIRIDVGHSNVGKAYHCVFMACQRRNKVGPGGLPATSSIFGVQCPVCVRETVGIVPKPWTEQWGTKRQKKNGGRVYKPGDKWYAIRLARQIYINRYRWILGGDEYQPWLKSAYIGDGFPHWEVGDVWSARPEDLTGLGVNDWAHHHESTLTT